MLDLNMDLGSNSKSDIQIWISILLVSGFNVPKLIQNRTKLLYIVPLWCKWLNNLIKKIKEMIN